jgi:hypothetical protein
MSGRSIFPAAFALRPVYSGFNGLLSAATLATYSAWLFQAPDSKQTQVP